jgi:S1-C subfamily serine protease
MLVPFFITGLILLQALERSPFHDPLRLNAHSLQDVPVDKIEKPKTSADTNQPILGLVVGDLNPTLARKMHLKSKSGVLIQKVLPNSVAESVGLQPKDIIRKINKKKIDSVKDYNKALKDLKNTGSLELVIEREGTELSVKLTVSSHGI